MEPLAHRVAALLAAEQFPSLLARRQALEAEVAHADRAHREASHAVPLWDELLFFHESADEKEVAELEQGLEERRAALYAVEMEIQAATQRIWHRVPAVEIAHRVESLISAVFAAEPRDKLPVQDSVQDGAVSPLLLSHVDAPGHVLKELDDLADRVFALWAPEMRPTDAVHALVTALSCADRGALPPSGARTDPDRGWAPITGNEVLARAAAALPAGEFARLQAAIGHALHDLERARARLLSLQSTPIGEPVAAAVARRSGLGPARAAVAGERARAASAKQQLQLALERAIGAYPPLAIATAARAAAGTARCAFASSPSVRTGQLLPTATPARAFFLNALLDLRKAVEAAFPGLSAVVSGRKAKAGTAARDYPARDVILSRLDGSRARQLLPAAVSLGQVWSAGAHADARRLRSWQTNQMFYLACELDAIVAHACDAQPFARMATSIERAWMALVHVDFSWAKELVFLHQQLEQSKLTATRAIDQIGADLRASFNLDDDLMTLAAGVAGVLRNGSVPRQPHATRSLPREGILRGLAGELSASTFLRDFDQFAATGATASFQGLDPRSAIRAEYAQRRAAVHASLEAVLGWYPPAALFFELVGVRARVLAIHIQHEVDIPSRCGRLQGDYEAQQAILSWRQHATRVFGRLLTGEYVLNEWMRRIAAEETRLPDDSVGDAF